MSVYRTISPLAFLVHTSGYTTDQKEPPGNFLIYHIPYLRFWLKDQFCFLYWSSARNLPYHVCLLSLEHTEHARILEIFSGGMGGGGAASDQGWFQTLYMYIPLQKATIFWKIEGRDPLSPPPHTHTSKSAHVEKKTVYVAEYPGCVWPDQKTRQFSFRRGSYPKSCCVR